MILPVQDLSEEKRADLNKLFNLMDVDGDGFVTRKEFEEFLIANNVALGRERIRQSGRSKSEMSKRAPISHAHLCNKDTAIGRKCRSRAVFFTT